MDSFAPLLAHMFLANGSDPQRRYSKTVNSSTQVGNGPLKSARQCAQQRAACTPQQLIRSTQLTGAAFHRRNSVASKASRARVATTICAVAPPKEKEALSDTLDKVRGNTQGAMLLIEGATVTIGNNDLIEDVGLKLMKGERWAIVGPNGTGKSTLLKAITGQEGAKLTTGRLALHPTCRVTPPPTPSPHQPIEPHSVPRNTYTNT
eukprot:594488-Prorocentrum_minimum.AAC.2